MEFLTGDKTIRTVFHLAMVFVLPISLLFFVEKNASAQVLPSQCPLVETVIVSDTSTTVDGGGSAVLTYANHPDWTATIPGASWIWKSYLVADPEIEDSTTFTRNFSIVSTPNVQSLQLTLSADNSYVVYFNGLEVARDDSEFNYKQENQRTIDLKQYITTGTNTLAVKVTNFARPGNTAETNPAGLLYKLVLTEKQNCVSANPPVITLLGANPFEMTVNTPFVDPGATAYDQEDGDLTNAIVRSGFVDASTTGSYTLTYVVKDSTNLYATTTRVVNVNSGTTPPPVVNKYCPNGEELSVNNFVIAMNDGLITHSISINSDKTVATFTLSNQTGCKVQTSLASYKMFDRTLGHQEMFDKKVFFSTSSPTVSYSVNLPSCMAQIDAWYGFAPDILTDNGNYSYPNNPFVIDFAFIHNSGSGYSDAAGQFCTHLNPTPTNHPPVITLLGANPFEMTVNTPFVDPGATAYDQEDGNLTSQIVSSSTVNANVVGTYTVFYSVKDSSNLYATTSRTVVVKPAGCTQNCGGGGGSSNPTVNITANPQVINSGATSTITWNSSNTISCSAIWTNSTSTSGSLIVSPATTTEYGITCTGPGGSKSASTTITVNLVSNPTNHPPVITLLGANPFEMTVNTPFVDPGATAYDQEDGNLTSQIVSSSTVNANVVGTYTVFYSVKDSSNLYATTSRTVVVKPAGCTQNCGGGGGSSNPTVNITANPNAVDPFSTSTITWTSTNTNSCAAGWTSATSTSGSATVNPGSTTEYGITCTGINGSVSATTTVTVNVPNNNGGGNNGGGGGGGGIGGRRHSVVVGEVLGATSCSYLRDYLKIDWQNDPVEVLKLKSFLNVFEKENLSLTTIYDQATFDAVARFQTKYNNDILEPWGPRVTKGFVYILTKKKINEIYCNTLLSLDQSDRDEINAFRSAGLKDNYSGTNNYSGMNSSSDTTGGLAKGGISNGVVVELKTASTGRDSLLKNAAVSLFAIPQKFLNNCKYLNYLLLVIVLILLAILLAKKFFNKNKKDILTDVASTDSNDAEISKAEILKPTQSSPIVAVPPILPGEEIIIDDEEEVIDEEIKADK